MRNNLIINYVFIIFCYFSSSQCKEIDIRESKVKQFEEKKNFLGYSYQEAPIIKQELIKGKPKCNYLNAFRSTLQLN